MHLYIMTKGIKNHVDQFITELQGKYLPFKYRKTLSEPLLDCSLQLAVRPIQLWEIGFPKEHKDLVCTSILGNEGGKLRGNDGTKPVEHTWIQKFIWGFKKLMGLKDIEPYKTDVAFPINRGDVAVVGIGIKEDYMMETGIEGI
jgi:hypothetical protein